MAKTTEESVPPNPNYVIVPTTACDPPPPQPTRCCSGRFYWRPGLRVTTEFDSDSSTFFHKISCKLLDSLAKLKVSFQNNDKGEISDPQLAFTSKYLSLHYDFEDQSAVVNSSFDLGPALHFKAAHNVKVSLPPSFDILLCLVVVSGISYFWGFLKTLKKIFSDFQIPFPQKMTKI